MIDRTDRTLRDVDAVELQRNLTAAGELIVVAELTDEAPFGRIRNLEVAERSVTERNVLLLCIEVEAGKAGIEAGNRPCRPPVARILHSLIPFLKRSNCRRIRTQHQPSR